MIFYLFDNFIIKSIITWTIILRRDAGIPLSSRGWKRRYIKYRGSYQPPNSTKKIILSRHTDLPSPITPTNLKSKTPQNQLFGGLIKIPPIARNLPRKLTYFLNRGQMICKAIVEDISDAFDLAIKKLKTCNPEALKVK